VNLMIHSCCTLEAFVEHRKSCSGGRQLFESHFFEVEMREFYIDWMRTIAVLMVVFVHVVVSVLRVVEVQPLLEGKINGTFRVLTQMGMPMLVSLMFGGVAEFF
jgi:hypothetical protein